MEGTRFGRKAKWILSLVAFVALIVGLVGGALLTSSAGATIDSLRGTLGGALVGSQQVKETAAAPAAQKPGRVTGPFSTVEAAKKVGPAVVTVVSQQPDSGIARGRVPGGIEPTAAGSGVIIDPSGYIVTNAHVVEGGNSLQVIFPNGTKVEAKLVGKDTFSDLAVLKVDGALPAVAEFGDSSALEPGEPVIAIGSALGNFRNTVTSGVVSALGRRLPGDRSSQLTNLIQTDAPINHGNSGGPLVNMLGQVVGINTAVVRVAGLSGDLAEGLGFAIPSNLADSTVKELISNGSVTRPYLGVQYQQLNPQIAAFYEVQLQMGALIMDVVPSGPADDAGLKKGDVILDVSGQKVDEEVTLSEVLLKHKPGETVRLKVSRDGKEQSIQVKLGERPNQ